MCSRPPLARRRSAAGFTLLEVLVVVLIGAIITGLLLTAVLRSRKSANVIRTKSDLSLIAIALDAYRADFQNVYPQFADLVTINASKAAPDGTGYWLDTQPDRGARLLCRALLGPGAAGPVTAGSFAGPGDDGADGNGFRARRNLVGSGSTFILAGKVSGPYLQSDKFKLEFDPATTYSTTTFTGAMADAKLLDRNGNPILYFPGRVGPAVVTADKGFVYEVNPATASTTPPLPQPLYNAFDNKTDTTAPYINRPFLAPAEMQYLLGDRDLSGKIDGTEVAVTTQPYLLWAANPNGPSSADGPGATPLYGLQPPLPASATSVPAGEKCDAVCNFDLPPDLRK